MNHSPDAPDERTQAFLQTLTDADPVEPGPRQLGTTTLVQQLGLPDDQLGGHWCSRCRGIWFGCALEVECPRCGHRHG